MRKALVLKYDQKELISYSVALNMTKWLTSGTDVKDDDNDNYDGDDDGDDEQQSNTEIVWKLAVNAVQKHAITKSKGIICSDLSSKLITFAQIPVTGKEQDTRIHIW